MGTQVVFGINQSGSPGRLVGILYSCWVPRHSGFSKLQAGWHHVFMTLLILVKSGWWLWLWMCYLTRSQVAVAKGKTGYVFRIPSQWKDAERRLTSLTVRHLWGCREKLLSLSPPWRQIIKCLRTPITIAFVPTVPRAHKDRDSICFVTMRSKRSPLSWSGLWGEIFYTSNLCLGSAGQRWVGIFSHHLCSPLPELDFFSEWRYHSE